MVSSILLEIPFPNFVINFCSIFVKERKHLGFPHYSWVPCIKGAKGSCNIICQKNWPMTRQDLQPPETINGTKNGTKVYCLFLFTIVIQVWFQEIHLQEIHDHCGDAEPWTAKVGQKLDKIGYRQYLDESWTSKSITAPNTYFTKLGHLFILCLCDT